MSAVADCLAVAKTYAAFIWPAYGFALVVLGSIAVQSWRRYRASMRDLDRLQRQLSPRR